MEIDHNKISFWEENDPRENFFKRLFFRKDKSKKKLSTPETIRKVCCGVSFKETAVKSILFSTDLALIENNDCDAVLAVYPFPPSAKIMKALIDFSEKPVICGIGGGLTQGKVALDMAIEAEKLGAAAVIVNQPFKNRDLIKIREAIRIPIVSSISTLDFDFEERIKAGVDIFHITGGANTGAIIEHITTHYPHHPMIATGGKTLVNIESVINSGAHAIVLTPPSNADLFKSIMAGYREGIHKIKKKFL